MKSPRRRFAFRHLITFILGTLSVVALVGSGLSLASGSSRSKEAVAGRGTARSESRLNPTISVHLASNGKRLLNLQEGHQLSVEYFGDSVASQALRAGDALPLSLASADFDADGAPDLVCGYSYRDGGIITIHRGNIAAFQTQDLNVYRRALKGESAASLFARADVYQLPERPDFLMVGDFDGDGRQDVLAAAHDGGLYLLAGDGAAGLGASQQISLGGAVTALASGNLSRERTGVVVAIEGGDGPSVLVFEGEAGGVLTAPTRFALSGEATALALGKLDNDSFNDLAVAVGNKVEIIHGWGWSDADRESRVEEIEVPFEVGSLAIGDFIWDRDFRSELALLSPDGNVHIFQRGQLDSRAFTDADKPALVARRVAAARAPMLTREQQINLQVQNKWDVNAREQWSDAQEFSAVSGGGNLASQTLQTGSHTTGRRTDDLFVLDAKGQQVHILVDTSTVSEPSNPRVPVSLDVDGAPLALVAMPQKINASRDLAVLSSAHAEAGNIVLAPQATFTVTQTADRASTCGSGGQCSLREAINSANNTAGTNTVNFSVNGTFTNTLGAFPAQGDVNSTNITILGSSPANTVIANTGSGVNHSVLYYGFANNQTFKVQNLTLQNGNTGDGFGGGALATGGIGWTVTVDNCVLNNNVSQSTSNGGAISQSGGGNFVIQNNTVISSNTATAAIGGGVCVNNSTNVGGLTVSNSTITGNTATAGAGAGQGGGIWIGVESGGGSVVTISQSTITSNAAGSQQGGGIFTNKGTIQFNRILANTAVTGGSGVFEPGGGFAVTANNNWWGCNTGPNGAATGGCSVAPNTTSGFTAPTAWLQLRNTLSGANVHNGQIAPGSNATFTADILGLNTGGSTAAGNLTGLATFPSSPAAIYSNGTPSLGSINVTTSQYVNGQTASATTFTSNGTKGTASVSAVADNQTLATSLTVGFTPEFVNAGGSDATPFSSSACGVSNTPCFATIGAALTNVAIGGTIHIQAGTYNESPNFNQNCTVSIDSNVQLNGSLTITTDTINENSFNLSLTGDFTKNGGTFNGNMGTLTFNGSGAQAINGTAASETLNNFTVNKSGGTLTVGGSTTSLTANNVTHTAGTFSAGTAATINVSGDWTNNGGTFTPGTAAVNFNNTSGAQNINGSAATQTFNSITVAKTAQTLSVGGSTTTLNLDGTLTLTSGTFAAGTATNINVGGDWTNNGGTFTPGSGTVTFNSAVAQNINGSAVSHTFNNLAVSKGGNSLTFGGTATALTINGSMTVNSGTFVAGTANNINMNGGDWTNNGGVFTPGSGTVRFQNTSGAQNINGSNATQTFNSIVVAKTAQTLSVAGNTSTLTLNGTMTLTSGTFAAGTATGINVGGNWTNNGGTFTPGSGTVTFNSTTAAQSINGSAATQTFNNLTENKTGQTLSVGGSTTTLNVNDLTITVGVFAAGTATNINVAGNWSSGGTFSAGSGTVTFTGNGNTQTLSGTNTYNNLTINHTGAGSVGASGSSLTVLGLLRIQGGTFTSSSTLRDVQVDSGQTLQGASATTMNVSGNWTNNGGVFSPNGNTVNFNGSVAQIIGGTAASQTFNNFTVNKTLTLSVGGSVTSITVNDLTITAGSFTAPATLDINGNTLLTAGTLTAGTSITAAGNWTNNGGVLTPGSGTVTFDGGAGQTIGGTTATTFNNFTNSDAGGISMNNDNTVNGILALSSSDITVANTKTLTQPGAIASTGAFDVVGSVKRTGSPNLATGTALTFGNPFNSVSFLAQGTTPTDITVNLDKAVPTTPAPFAGAIARKYTITPTGGSGISATLRLHYLDSELNGNTEGAGLNLFRYDGANWHKEGQTGFNTTDNWVEKSGVTQFSPWTMNSTVPTAARLESFRAVGYDGGAFIEWGTGFEVDNLGFNVYREEGGKRVLITPQILAGSALVTGPGTPLTAGKSYSWWDSGVSSKETASYWLEELDVKGKSIWHGPVNAKFVGGPPPEQARAAELAGLGGTDAPSRPVQTWATPAKIAIGRSPLSFSLASQFAVKIFVNHEGWYRVTQAELLAVGLAPKTDPRNLQLYVDGQPQAISVIGESDGKLDASDAVEFYGVGMDSPQTNTRVYWLAAGATPGLRITSAPSAAPPTAGGNFPFAVERRDRTIYFSGLLNGEIENFFGAVIASQPVNQSLTVTNMDAAASGGTLEVALQGVTFVTHQINVSLNGLPLGNLVFSGQSAGLATFGVPPGVLQQGANQVTLAVSGGGGDVSLVDHLRLTYNHTYTADNDLLKLTTAANQQLTIGGFSANTVRVFDITNPAAVQEVIGQVQQQGASYGVALFVPGTGQRTLLALTGGQTGPAKQVAANLPSSWNKTSRGADFLIITPRAFFAAVEPLRVARLNQGLAGAIVDIEDIYDEFSFGQKTPQAIKDFLAFAGNSWKKRARYAVFVGDACYDPKNYLGFGEFDLVPTKLIDTIFMEASSDDWLADFNGDGVPELSVGRLPVRKGEEAEMLIAKIIGYDKSIRPDEMLLVADANDSYDFEAASAELHPLVPGDARAVDLNRGQMSDAAAKAALLDAIARGQRYVNYTGHGNVNQWHGNLLTNEDAAALDNADHLPVFLMMTCLNGYFNDPALDSIAEKLLMNPKGGAVAVWTSTGQTLPGGQWAINQEMYFQMFSAPQVRLGDAARAAKVATTDIDVRQTWILFGDPTMRLR